MISIHIDNPQTAKRVVRLVKLLPVFILLIIVIAIESHLHKPKLPIYQNCTQIKAYQGRSYIRSTDPLYQSRLDGDHNGIACE